MLFSLLSEQRIHVPPVSTDLSACIHAVLISFTRFYGLLSILETHSIRPVGESNDKDFHSVIRQALISTELISALK